MVAEIICVGTELLLGDILNSNAQFLAKELASLGIPHYYQTVVGDNPERIKQVIEIAIGRSQLLVFTGGLGPTPDDLTVETIADYFGVPLIERPEIIADIEQKFAQRGRTMSKSNRKQALIPEGADILSNRTGSAPGIIWQPVPNVTVMTFPGVPAEMHLMWQEIAVPYLKNNGWCSATICSRTLKFWGIAESALAEKVDNFLNLTNPTVAPYANHGEVKLRISARAESEVAAKKLIEPIEQQLLLITDLDCYGADTDTLASTVGKLLLLAGETLSVAESCTGGGLGAMLTAVPGSSRYFLGGIISYDDRVKEGLLGVNPQDLAEFGAVSQQVAKQMAAGVRASLNTTWGLSITGIAGPGGGTDAKPVGLVYIGLAGPEGETESFEYRFGYARTRDWIRNLSSCTALDRLRRKLLLAKA
ncbi:MULTISPECIES: competence/damage-inducible protein A [unclassified Microcoleus]|uniref:competence/damage-inducible protein A n=1 Tax=unclassified Microcoleus TaxID=2642155 RepID=UPI001DCFA4B0|nr:MULTISPECIES: competence/damage-inducible protein A [unclassified Microcoleus]MCC3411888.1 competence/damage-inducible protein A [Microcoleus sp. PH2017_02_FOX_O_A]MCC3517371.1 competence/damage-inducible protein A [Microcoleus sp. PH2017_18_LLB_O_A]